MWFTRAALDGYNRAELPQTPNRPPRKTGAAPVSRACPQCFVALRPEDFEGTILDVCSKCGGVWLDPGEYPAARKRGIRARLAKHVPSVREEKWFVRAAIWVIDLIDRAAEAVEPDELEPWPRDYDLHRRLIRARKRP